MTTGFRTIIIPVKDLDAARTLYTALLGVEPAANYPYYVGYDAGDQHIGLDPAGHGGAAGPVAYWHTDDIDGEVARLTGAGATVDQPIGNAGGGPRRAVVRDGDGNVFGVIENKGGAR
jgi:predicted enzyme related to lactoylglutathione lyase